MIEEIKSIYGYVKNWFWALPVWKRAILSSLIGALGGSSLIGFLNRYALYYHAYYQGFRIPVEGVEYLNLAVALVSFAIIFSSIAGTIFIYNLLNYLASVFEILIIKDKKNVARKQFERKHLSLSLSIVIFLIYILYLLLSVALLGFGIFEVRTHLLFFGLVLGVLMIGFGLSTNDNLRKVFTLVVVVAVILLIATSLFNQTFYSKFLQVIQYGGRIPVQVEYRKADNTDATIEGQLLIRTNKSITIMNQDNSGYSEIPAERVSKITFRKSK